MAKSSVASRRKGAPPFDPASAPFDVVVAGAGPAGATLSLCLRDAGFRVALIDGAPSPADMAASDTRASAIAYSVARLWRRLGLALEGEIGASRLERIVVTDGARPGPGAGAAFSSRLVITADQDLPVEDFGEPLGWIVENRRLMAALEARLKVSEAETGSRLVRYRPAKAMAFVDRGPHAEISLEDGRVLVAKLVIAAEGRLSNLRASAAISTSGWAYGQTAVSATVVLAEPHEGVAWQHFTPTGPVALLPLSGNRASLVWTESAAHAAALLEIPEAGFLSLLSRRLGDGPQVVALEGPRRAFPLSLLSAERMTAPRLALLGDTAHGVHPLAGQGLNLGLKDVAALIAVVSEAHAVGEDIGAEMTLARYAQWRRFDTASSIWSADLIGRLFTNDQLGIRAVRDVALATAGASSALRRILAREAGGGLGDRPAGLRA